MGVFDLFPAFVAVVSYLIGRSRGLVWQLSGIATLVVGGVSATILCRPVGRLIGGEGLLAQFGAWVLLYAVVATCLYVLTLKTQHRIKDMEYEELDKRFGGMLGAVKGLLVFAVIVLVAVALSDGIAGVVKRSASGQALRYLVHELRQVLPEKIYDAFGPWRDRVVEALGPLDPQDPAAPPAEPPPSSPSGPLDLPSPGPERAAPVVPPPPPPSQRPTAPPQAPPPPPPPPSPLPPTEPVLPFPEASPPPPSRPAPPPPDPFDTSEDPPDPLAPPAEGD